jgi:uncharacterized protein with GYD domain
LILKVQKPTGGKILMAIFITQGRYSHEAITGMVARPEDRTEAVAKLAEKAGGKLLAYYVTFGEYDFMVITEMHSYKEASALVIAAAAGGGATHLKTTVAMTTAEAKQAFAAASELAQVYRAPGAR